MNIKKFTPPTIQNQGLYIGISESKNSLQKNTPRTNNQNLYSATIVEEPSLLGDPMDDYTINPLTL